MSEQKDVLSTRALIGDAGEDEAIYWLDLLVQDLVILEIKDAKRFDLAFEAQVMSYLKIIGKEVGLPVSFNSRLSKDGIRRFVLKS